MKRFIAGAMAGAVAMYLLDPDRGRGRRARVRQQWSSRVRSVDRAADRFERDAANRAEGARARADGKGVFHPSDDRALEVHLHQVLEELDVATSERDRRVGRRGRACARPGRERGRHRSGRAGDQRRAGSARRGVVDAPARRARAEQEACVRRGYAVELCTACSGGDEGNRTPVQGFAGPCLSHSATSPGGGHPSEGPCVRYQ